MKIINNHRQMAVLLYAFIFAYVLSFVFQGRVYYQLLDQLHYTSSIQNLLAMFLHMLGLLSASFLIKNKKHVCKIMVVMITICIFVSPIFLVSNIHVGNLVVSITSYCAGVAIANWGAFYKYYVSAKERLKAMADALILANILMIVAGVVATYISAIVGFILALMYLICAIILLLACDHTVLESAQTSETDMFMHGNSKTWILFFAFITIVTVDSGLMYGVVSTKYQQLDWLASWYWAVPYIIALFFMKLCSKGKSSSKYLYLAIIMIATGFVCFRMTDISAGSYILIDTFLLAGSAILDLFWSSIVGEAMDGTNRPIRVLGIGWSANVCGVLIGSILSQTIIHYGFEDGDVTIVALVFICITLVILPEMISHLRMLLKNNMYLSHFVEKPKEVQQQVTQEMTKQMLQGEMLTTRENEILQLILQGKSNKLIAEELAISENTVKTHVRNILSKFAVCNRTELISLMLQNRN